MNLFVLSGHGSESFCCVLKWGDIPKNNAALITVIPLHLRMQQRDSLPYPDNTRLGFRKIVLNPSLTCDVITTSLWSHVPHFIHLITLFEAIPID